MISNNTICYEGVQRVYRNAVVVFMRNKLREKYPDDYLGKVKVPFKAGEWDCIERNANILREAGVLTAKIVDDFDLLSVNHFFNVFDKYYDDFFDERAEAKKKSRQTLLRWVGDIKDLRDPLSHPAEEDFTYEDCFLLLASAKKVLIKIGADSAVSKMEGLTDSLGGVAESKDEVEPLEDCLPPKESVVSEFIGRKDELSELQSWFNDPTSRRWALAGAGGKGKTALAYQFALEVKMNAPRPYQSVLWMTAKKQKYVDGVIVSTVDPDFFDLDSALNYLLDFFGWLDDGDVPVDTKKKNVIDLLEAFPSLVVVDDIDSVDPENEDVIEFFSFTVPSTKSKVLFTSRRVLFGLGKATTSISGLNKEDTGKLVFSLCHQFGLDEKPFRGLVEQILKITEGSPLYIEDLLRLSAAIGIGDAIKSWMEKGGDEARKYALGRECDLLTIDARRVLFSACVCNKHISIPEISEVLNFPADKITSSIQELQRLFLIPKPNLIEGAECFEVNVNTKSLVREVYSASDVYKKVDAAYKSVTGKITNIAYGDVGRLIRQAVFHIRAHRQEVAEKLLRDALVHYPENRDLLGVLGLVYKSWVPIRITDARECFSRSKQLKNTKKDMFIHWVKMECGQNEWTKAFKAAEAGLRYNPDDKILLYYAGYAKSRLAKELFRSMQKEKGYDNFLSAENHLLKALSVRATDNKYQSNIYRALVLLYEAFKNTKKVKIYFQKWEREFPDDHNLKWEKHELIACKLAMHTT